MPTGDIALALVRLIYDAAMDAGRWPQFLEALNRTLEGESTGLHLLQVGEQPSREFVTSVGVDAGAQQQYNEYYAASNTWTIRGAHANQEGAVLTGEIIRSNSALEKSACACDGCRPSEFYHSLASVPAADASATFIVTTLRSRRRGPFEPDCIELQQLLMPHLRRAAEMQHRLLAADLERRALREALEALPTGVILLNRRRRVIFANRAARGIAAARDGMELTADGLTGSHAADTERLRGQIGSALLARSSGTASPGAPMRLSRPSGRRPLEVLVASVGASAGRLAHADCAIVVFVADPERNERSITDSLQALYALTPAEARLAAGLTQGRTLSEVAEDAHITQNTARWTVKQVLHKTGASTQAQAVALILSGVARLPSLIP